MAVSNPNQAAYFVPVFRPQELRQTEQPAIVGRWHWQDVTTGDGSGGNATTICSLEGMSSLFGSHALLDLQTLVYTSIGAAAPAYMQFNFQVAEPTTGQAYINFMAYINASGTIEKNPMFNMKYRVIPGAIGNSIYFVCPNLATLQHKVNLAGYVYDERLL